jgi:hypothetical protein
VKRETAVFRVESHVRAVNAATERALERALNRVAIHWHAEARQAAPVDTGRLMSSIAFSTPTSNAFHQESYAGRGSKPGGTVAYQPPRARGLEAMVGTNVEYAAAVHERHRDKRGFIEVPGRENAPRYRGMISEALTSLGRAADD